MPGAHDPGYVARGERVALGPLRKEYAPLYARWVNDPEVKAGILTVGLFTPADEERFVEESQKESAQMNPTGVRFTIHDRSDGAPVGICGLDDIDWRHRTCEFGINLGERRGTGLGTEATRLALDWAFTVLSLHNVMLRSYDYNARAQRAYEKAGFKLIGRRRQAMLAGGRLRDELLMDALASEFEGSVLGPTEVDRR